MSHRGPDFSDTVPWSDSLTDYDRTHGPTYLRLLDAERAGASIKEMAPAIFGIDPQEEPGRALQVVDAHLKRAHWMIERGYRHFLNQ